MSTHSLYNQRFKIQMLGFVCICAYIWGLEKTCAYIRISRIYQYADFRILKIYAHMTKTTTHVSQFVQGRNFGLKKERACVTKPDEIAPLFQLSFFYFQFIREGCQKSKWKFKMAFAIRRPTPPPP